MINPYWIEDRDLKKGEVDYISAAEAQFWKDLLEKYLHPIDENKEEKVCALPSSSKIEMAWKLILMCIADSNLQKQSGVKDEDKPLLSWICIYKQRHVIFNLILSKTRYASDLSTSYHAVLITSLTYNFYSKSPLLSRLQFPFRESCNNAKQLV